MVTSNERYNQTLYRSIPNENNHYGVNVYKWIDNRFYVYRTAIKNNFIKEEFVGRCTSEEMLQTFINTITKTTIK